MGNSYSKVAPLADLSTVNVPSSNYPRTREHASPPENAALSESVFHSMLTLERMRAERSNKAFILMLLDANPENGAAAGILKQAAEVALATKRETDLVGWYLENAVLGIIFTEINLETEHPVREILRLKMEAGLSKHLGPEKAKKIAISLHSFAERGSKIASR